MTDKQEYIFNTNKFASEMQKLLGGRYISILANATNTTYYGASRWCKQEIATKDGPSQKKRAAISDFIFKRFNKHIIWSDYIIDKNDILHSNNTLTSAIEDTDSQIKSELELMNIHKENEQLRKKIRILEIKLQEEINKNVELQLLLNKT